MHSLVKFAVSGVIILVLFIIAVSILKFTIKVLLPIAIIVLAAYAVYVLATGKRAR